MSRWRCTATRTRCAKPLLDALAHQGAEWEVRVQLLTNLERMPIEDASVAWPEDISPYRAVARIRVPAQPAWNEERAAQADDGLAFSPWHGLAAHQPLGSINRARRPTYAAISAFRAERNRQPIEEPRSAFKLSGAPASAIGTTPEREGFRNAADLQQPGPQEAGLAQRVMAGAAGGLAGGLLVSAILLLKQAVTGQPSDLAQLKRKLTSLRPSTWRRSELVLQDESASHAGHLGLSIGSGALYGALKPANTEPLTSGLAFGAGFMALACAGIGPALRLTPPPSRDTRANNLQHVVVHALFGITTALVADRVAQRLALRWTRNGG